MAKTKQPPSTSTPVPPEDPVEQRGAQADVANAECDQGVHQVQKLQAELKSCQSELKSCQAELKIHKAAWESEAEKFSALSAKAECERNEHDVVVAQLQHVSKLIRTAEAAHYELLTTQGQFDAEGWQRLYQQLVKAVMPVFTYRG
jgi:chromosome segregation ATPase